MYEKNNIMPESFVIFARKIFLFFNFWGKCAPRPCLARLYAHAQLHDITTRRVMTEIKVVITVNEW